MKPTPFTLDHIHYKSQNFDETKRFYVNVMGATDLRIIQLGPPPEPGNQRPDNLQMTLAGVDLLFAQDDKSSTKPTEECGFPCQVPPWNTRHGVYHIAILVDNCKEATKYFYELAQAEYKEDSEDPTNPKYVEDGTGFNVVAIEPFDAGDNITASFLYAPDGMAIELKENRK